MESEAICGGNGLESVQAAESRCSASKAQERRFRAPELHPKDRRARAVLGETRPHHVKITGIKVNGCVIENDPDELQRPAPCGRISVSSPPHVRVGSRILTATAAARYRVVPEVHCIDQDSRVLEIKNSSGRDKTTNY